MTGLCRLPLKIQTCRIQNHKLGSWSYFIASVISFCLYPITTALMSLYSFPLYSLAFCCARRGRCRHFPSLSIRGGRARWGKLSMTTQRRCSGGNRFFVACSKDPAIRGRAVKSWYAQHILHLSVTSVLIIQRSGQKLAPLNLPSGEYGANLLQDFAEFIHSFSKVPSASWDEQTTATSSASRLRTRPATCPSEIPSKASANHLSDSLT